MQNTTVGNRKTIIRERLLQLVQANRAATDTLEKAWCKVRVDQGGASATRDEIGHLLDPIEDRIHVLAVQQAGLQFRLSLVTIDRAIITCGYEYHSNLLWYNHRLLISANVFHYSGSFGD